MGIYMMGDFVCVRVMVMVWLAGTVLGSCDQSLWMLRELAYKGRTGFMENCLGLVGVWGY